ncbi:YajQ family cyclic di-GMP-binding protein [Patescibacteria group bacterium]|nr:YajQ family cyclic di-GMP-binding protein [Patescibacteria group bacterium]
MADASMDIMCDFNFHELTNAVDQTRREIIVRYDLKSLGIEINQNDDEITITAPSELALNSSWDVLLQKFINRNLSPKILEKCEMEKLGGSDVRYTIKLTKVLDSDTAKKVAQMIRDNFKKAKSSIQGQTVRVSSKSRDELQAIQVMLKGDKSIELPLKFGNYR